MMEQEPRMRGESLEELNERIGISARADYDDAPTDDQPWLYVVNAKAWDQGAIEGAWVPADLNAHHVAAVVSAVSEQTLLRAELAVIDQLGIDTMVDEDHFVPLEWKNPA